MITTLHQTWKDENVPEYFCELSKTWKGNHPGWQYILWTDEMNRKFIKDKFPDFLSIYDGYETNIQRVDAVRYFILYKMGGLYVDLDFKCLTNMEPILTGKCIFGLEPDEHCKIHKRDMIISNALMYADAEHPFFEALCSRLYKTEKKARSFNDILSSTGPFMLTDIYKKYHTKEQIKLLPCELVYPLTKEELEHVALKGQQNWLEAKLNKAYAIHYYYGTWWKPKCHFSFF